MKDGLPPNFTSIAQGGDVNAVIAAEKAKAEIELGQDISEFNATTAEMSAINTQPAPDPEPIATRDETELKAVSKTALIEINAASVATAEAGKAEVVFRLQHNLTRNVVRPDVLTNVFVLGLMTFVETTSNAMLFYTGGFVAGFAEAVAFGAIIAGTTTVFSAFVGGGLCGRYWNYDIYAEPPLPSTQAPRRFGRIGSVLTAMIIAGLIFAAALLRTTGEPDNLSISFETVSSLVSNFHSLMLIALGIGFAILSWRTGLRAFDDPYPGFLAACNASSGAADHQHVVIQETLDTLYTINKNAMDELSIMADDDEDARQDIAEWMETSAADKEIIISAISSAQSGIAMQAAQFVNMQKMINGSKKKSPVDFQFNIDLSHLQTRIKEPETPEANPQNGFASAHKAAVNKVSEAYSQALEHICSAISPETTDDTIPPKGDTL